MTGLVFAAIGAAATLGVVALMFAVMLRAIARAITGSHRTYTYRPDGSVVEHGE